MTGDEILFCFVVGLLTLTGWFILTNKTTPEERDAMLRDEEMWP